MAREGGDVISMCCMKNDAGNVVSDTRWMTDLINHIVKHGYIPDDWRKNIRVPMYKGKVIHLGVGHTKLLSYWSNR